MAKLKKPLTVDEIALLMKDRGDERSIETLRMHISRAIRADIENGGTLKDARKVNPGRGTSPWLVPADAVSRWFDESSI